MRRAITSILSALIVTEVVAGKGVSVHKNMNAYSHDAKMDYLY